MTVTDADSIGVLTMATTRHLPILVMWMSAIQQGICYYQRRGENLPRGKYAGRDFSTGLTLTGDNNSLTMAMRILMSLVRKLQVLTSPVMPTN